MGRFMGSRASITDFAGQKVERGLTWMSQGPLLAAWTLRYVPARLIP
jgi:hypothetical protein